MFDVIGIRNQDPDTSEVLATFTFRAEAVSYCVKHRDEFEYSGYNIERDQWWGYNEVDSDKAREWFIKPSNN